MILREKVQAIVVGRAPRPICDSCLADHLFVTRKQVRAAAAWLNDEFTLQRSTGQCSGCCTNRSVTAMAAN